MKLRKPRIRLGRKGIGLSGGGIRIGGRRFGINIGRRGISGTIGSKYGSYNARRGCALNPFACCSVIAGLPFVALSILILVMLL